MTIVRGVSIEWWKGMTNRLWNKSSPKMVTERLLFKEALCWKDGGRWCRNLEGKVGQKKLFFFSNTRVYLLAERKRPEYMDWSSVNIHSYNEHLLTFIIVKKNMECKKKKKKSNLKYTAQWFTTKWRVIWPRNITLPEPLIQCNHFPYFASGFCDLNVNPKN